VNTAVIRAGLVALMVLALSGLPTRVFAACKIGRLAELPVTMTGLRPLVSAKINGSEALFIADSGAFYSMITPAAAAQFKLKLGPAPYRLELRGVGGEARAWVTTVKTFTLFDVPIPNVEFIVGGNDEGPAGLLGQNVFRIADVEYDLASGAIRLMRPHDCRKAMLAYWAASQPYSVVDIDPATPQSPHTTTFAYLNGARIRVLFDTGAATSVVSLAAAGRAGVKPGADGVVDGGLSYGGVGSKLVQTWIAPFASFRIGDEEIRNTRLRVGAIEIREADMLIGADFFLSHRIYVASSQHKLYFTYNGGPVFNLAHAPSTQAATSPPPGGSPQPQEQADQPNDAAALSRRGTAFTARRDYEHAIADLTRACELEPNEPRYFYERGQAHRGNKQPDLAMADFDQALKLKPDYVDALVARAQLRLQRSENSAAVTDLDAAGRFAPEQGDIRLPIGLLYARAGLLAEAVAQYDKWITAHESDVQLPDARNSRCWARALWGQELDKALADCNGALKARPDTAAFLDSRGLVRLRMGDLDKSIADYDAALKLQPHSAWSLYGRGLARLKKGLTTAGEADIAAATAIQPRIEDEARTHGITR
jgi:tetratricopeptide (TPR) repeat protein/predicted aspartyl protease